MHKYSVFTIMIIVLLAGCTRAIRVDSNAYLQNPGQYQDKDIIIISDFVQVLDKYEQFKGKTVEVTARIAHFEDRDAAAWYLILEKDGRQLRAYEDDFLKYVPADAVYLARWAKNEGGYVTVRGRLLDNRMELNQLVYKNLIVDTSAIPT